MNIKWFSRTLDGLLRCFLQHNSPRYFARTAVKSPLVYRVSSCLKLASNYIHWFNHCKQTHLRFVIKSLNINNSRNTNRQTFTLIFSKRLFFRHYFAYCFYNSFSSFLHFSLDSFYAFGLWGVLWLNCCQKITHYNLQVWVHATKEFPSHGKFFRIGFDCRIMEGRWIKGVKGYTGSSRIFLRKIGLFAPRKMYENQGKSHLAFEGLSG